MSRVARLLQRRLEEAERVLRDGGEGSPLIAEIIRAVEFAGPLTPGQLSAETGFRLPIIRKIIEALLRQGLLVAGGGRVSLNARRRRSLDSLHVL